MFMPNLQNRFLPFFEAFCAQFMRRFTAAIVLSQHIRKSSGRKFGELIPLLISLPIMIFSHLALKFVNPRDEFHLFFFIA